MFTSIYLRQVVNRSESDSSGNKLNHCRMRADLLFGGLGSDVVHGNAGDDKIHGRGADHTKPVGDGADTW